MPARWRPGLPQVYWGGSSRRSGWQCGAEAGAAARGAPRAGDAGAVAAVFAVDVLDDLFAPLVFEIDVDVGRLVALARDESLHEQLAARRIHLGDAEAVT